MDVWRNLGDINPTSGTYLVRNCEIDAQGDFRAECITVTPETDVGGDDRVFLLRQGELFLAHKNMASALDTIGATLVGELRGVAVTMPWTRLEGTPIWRQAVPHYAEPWRDYHGLWHLERIYHHAAETFGFAYDEDLDLAILAHDVVMDFDGRDELFSARWLRTQTDGTHPRAEALILTTKDHRPGPGDTRLARLDIAGFIDDAERREGTRRLRVEAANRHLSHEDWINGSHAYLTGLLGRVAGGIMHHPQLEARDQWLRIMDGIGETLGEMEAGWCGFGPEAGAQ